MGFLGLQFHNGGLKLLQHYVHGMRKGTHLGVFRQHGGAAIQVAAPRAGYIIAGFDVPHTHIHVFPTSKMSDYDFSKVIGMNDTDPAKMDAAASALRAELAKTNPAESA